MIYDIHTKNISFLKISKVLRERGVKNNKFMLELYDEDLAGVDPYSEKVANSAELQLKIYREICRNYWYFIREVCRVPIAGADVHYELNLGNCTMGYIKLKNKNLILILPRQHGKTMGEAVFDVWQLCFVAKNSNIVYSNKAKPDAIKNLKLFKDIKDLLPRWLLDVYVNHPKKDMDNQETKLIFKRNNTLKVMAPATDPDGADKAGRGLTVAGIVLDEFAFLKFSDIIMAAAVPAWKKAAEAAKKNHIPYGITIITTPNNLDNPSGKYCHDMIANSAKWTLGCFDMDDTQLDEFIEANSQNNYIFVQYTYSELGRSEEWLKEMIRDLNNDLAKVKREILLEWPKSMEFSVFNEEQLDKVYHFVKQPCTTILIFNKYPLDFYETPDLNKNYILSCDVAGGLSHDNSVINIIDPEDFRIVGDFVGNKIDTDTFRDLIKEVMVLYMRNSLLVIEKNSYGLNILQTFMKDPLIEPRMYRETKETLGEKKMQNGFIVKKKTNTISYGVDTNTITRKQMFDLLPEIVETEYDKIISPNIYKNLVTLERKKTGKIEHASGAHDDSLMAYLIFRWAVYYGKCFRDRFGISPVPSRMNVRTISNSDNLTKIAQLIDSANKQSEQAAFRSSSAYQALADQERKIQDKNPQVNSFMKLLDL